MSVNNQDEGQETKRSYANRGRNDILINNINVARMVKRIVGSTLGPLGMSKILVKSRKKEEEDHLFVSSDGALILENMKMEHPVAKILATLAKAQKDEFGDGATTAVILSCSLLESAEELLGMGLHPSLISEGFTKAEEKVDQTLHGLLTTIDMEEQSALRGIIMSVMNSRIVHDSPQLFELMTDFVIKLTPLLRKSKVKEATPTEDSPRLENIRIVKKIGGLLSQSELMIRGFIIEDREVVHPNMPRRVENGSIALVKNLEVKRLPPKTTSKPSETIKIEIEGLEDYIEFTRNRSKLAESLAEKIAETGANVALVNSGIDDLVQHYLSRHGIMAVKRVKAEDLELIAKLTQGEVVGNVDELETGRLGKAETIEEVTFSGDGFCIRISGCRGEGMATVVLRGSGKTILDESERCLRTALRTVSQALNDPQIVFGGGAAEAELACELQNYALSFSDKGQFAIQKYASALNAVPRVLAQNAGMDVAKAIIDLHKAHNNGLSSFGIDATQHRIGDMRELKVFDLARMKRNAILTATETSISILRTSGIERVQRRKGENDRSALPKSESGESNI